MAPQDANSSGLNVITVVMIVVLTFLFFGGIAWFLSSSDAPISSVRATRPILVFTLIVAMLGFGGMLMFRSLFGGETQTEFEQRFRLAREIFLVYAGIFGTIIGFYFGAADGDAVPDPVSAALTFSDGQITAQAAGGTPPFAGYLQRKDPPLNIVLEANGNDRALTGPLPAGSCPQDATVFIIDGAGHRGTVEVQEKDLANLPACDATLQRAAAQAGSAPAAGSGNNATPAP